MKNTQKRDNPSKMTEFYERLKKKQANQAEIKDVFSFLDEDTCDKLPLTRWLDKSGHPIPGEPEFPAERAAEIKVLAMDDPVPLELLVRCNLVQQEHTRLGINSIALLHKTMSVAPDVMRKLRDLLDREVERQEHEWMETMHGLIITERTEKIPVAIRSRDVERDCRSIVSQLLNSIPKDVLLRFTYVEHQKLTSTQSGQGVSIELKSRMVMVIPKFRISDAKKEYEYAWTVHPEMRHRPEMRHCRESPQESGRGAELSGEWCSIGPGQDDLSGESMSVRTTEGLNFDNRGVEKREEQVRSRVDRLDQLK